MANKFQTVMGFLKSLRNIGLLDPLYRFSALSTRIPFFGEIFHPWFRDYNLHMTVIPVNARLPVPESTPLPMALLEYLIAEASFRFMFYRCPCREMFECEDYPRDIGCIFLGRDARRIDRTWGRQASAAECLAHAERAVSLGLVPMFGKFRMDNIGLGIPDRKRLISICFCCECCCLFRYTPLVAPQIQERIRRLEGITVRVNDGCDSCGKCLDVCAMGAISLNGVAEIDQRLCKGCGRCAAVCPIGAIEVVIESTVAKEEILARLRGVADIR